MALVSCGVVRQRHSPQYHAGVPIQEEYVPRGTVVGVPYQSSVKGPSERRMIVYLPEGYGREERRYPVFYLLHGARGYETSWIKKGEILRIADSLFSHGLAVPSIIVMPNMNEYRNERDFDESRMKDAIESILEVNGAVESAFPKDVVHLVDSLFLTQAYKSGRALAGLSIGGKQSAFLAANFPEVFGYVGLFSPFFQTRGNTGRYKSFYKNFRDKLDIQFKVDPPQAYYLMVGRKDVVYPTTLALHRYMTGQGYPHEFHVSDGGHNWSNWRNYLADMLTKVFKDAGEDNL
jgi:enterochelin esterase family protein